MITAKMRSTALLTIDCVNSLIEADNYSEVKIELLHYRIGCLVYALDHGLNHDVAIQLSHLRKLSGVTLVVDIESLDAVDTSALVVG